MLNSFRKHPTDCDPILAVSDDDKFFSPPFKEAPEMANWVAKNHHILPPVVKVGTLDLSSEDWNSLINLVVTNFNELKFSRDVEKDFRPRADHIVSWKRAIKMINDPHSPHPYKDGRLWFFFKDLDVLKIGPDWKVSVMQAIFNRQVRQIIEKIDRAECDIPITKNNYQQALHSIAKLKDGQEIFGPEALNLKEIMDFFWRVVNIRKYNSDKLRGFIKDIIAYYECREKLCLDDPDEIIKFCLDNSFKIEAEIQKNSDQGVPDDLTDTISGDSDDPGLITQRKFTAAYLEYILSLGKTSTPFIWRHKLNEIGIFDVQ